MHALGTGYARKSGEPPGFRLKEGTCASTGGKPCQQDKYVTLAAIIPPGVAQGRFVGGHQSGVAGCKLPPLFKHGASFCLSQRQTPAGPMGRLSTTKCTHLPAAISAPYRAAQMVLVLQLLTILGFLLALQL